MKPGLKGEWEEDEEEETKVWFNMTSNNDCDPFVVSAPKSIYNRIVECKYALSYDSRN